MAQIKEVLTEYVNFLNTTSTQIRLWYLNMEQVVDNVFVPDLWEEKYYQFLWEMMVEAQICTPGFYLQPYGTTPDSKHLKRVTFPNQNANKFIKVKVSNQYDYMSKSMIETGEFEFGFFNCFENEFPETYGPFRHVLCYNGEGKIFVFLHQDVVYSLSDSE